MRQTSRPLMLLVAIAAAPIVRGDSRDAAAAPPRIDPSIPPIDIAGPHWTFVGGKWLPASPSPYPYSGGPGGQNIKGSYNAPAYTIVPGRSNEFGIHPVVDDMHLAIYTLQPYGDFSASFDLTHTAQLSSGAFVSTMAISLFCGVCRGGLTRGGTCI
jgi:hypothetical protein